MLQLFKISVIKYVSYRKHDLIVLFRFTSLVSISHLHICKLFFTITISNNSY